MRRFHRISLMAVIAVLGLVPALMGGGVAHAASVNYFVATNGTDTTGDCSTNSPSNAFPRIAQALACAHMDTENGIATASAPDTITIAPGTYSEYNLDVAANVRITGKPGATFIDPRGELLGLEIPRGRVMRIESGETVSMSGLSLGHGAACLALIILWLPPSEGIPAIPFYCRGGGIYNAGTLSISNSTVTNNAACSGNFFLTVTPSDPISFPIFGGCNGYSGSVSGRGGGIYNAGTLTISNSTVTGNAACAGTVSASFTWNGTSSDFIIAGCASDSDSAGGQGGGIYNAGTLTVSNSTLSDNAACAGSASVSAPETFTALAAGCYSDSGIAAGQGGGIYNEGTLTINHSSLSGNIACARTASGTGATARGCDTDSGSAGGQGGGIYNDSGSNVVRLNNSSLSDNAACSAEDTTSGVTCQGGAIYNDSGTPTFNKKVSFSGNTPTTCYDVNTSDNTLAGCPS